MPFAYPPELRAEAVRLVRAGLRPVAAARQLGVSTAAVYLWLDAAAPELVSRPRPCFRCTGRSGQPQDPGAYAHLLGLYLGDGYLRRHPNGTYDLAVFCADAWPGLRAECEQVLALVSDRTVLRVPKSGCCEVKAYWKHWPCLFPQHGPGRKHERPIVLEPWQQEVVAAQPGRFLRGLFHSDGWRGTNVAVHRAPDGFVTRYQYSRYEFTNRSADIRRLCTGALDLLGIAWRTNGRWRISVNRRAAVAALDEHVGPKA